MIISPRSSSLRARAEAAFSLVEVTLAIGIVAFAFLALFGLVPTGLNVFRSAVDSSIGTQILDQTVQAAQQTDYDLLATRRTSSGDVDPLKDYKGNPQYYTYYDEQGNLLVDDQGVPVKKNNDPRSIYTVFTIALYPTVIPNSAGTSSNDAAGSTDNVATLSVLIAKNPGHNPAPFADSNKANFTAYAAYIARNKSAFETRH